MDESLASADHYQRSYGYSEGFTMAYKRSVLNPADMAKLSNKHHDAVQKIDDRIVRLGPEFKYEVERSVKEAMFARSSLREVRDLLEVVLEDPQGLQGIEKTHAFIESLNGSIQPNAIKAASLSKSFEHLFEAILQTQKDAQKAVSDIESGKVNDESRRFWAGIVAGVAAIAGLVATIASAGILLPVLPVIATIGGAVSGTGMYAAFDAHKDITSAESALDLMRDISKSMEGPLNDFEAQYNFWANLKFDIEQCVIQPGDLIRGENLSRGLVRLRIKLLESTIAQYENCATTGRKAKAMLSIN